MENSFLPPSTVAARTSLQSSYTDLNQLHRINQLGKDDQAAALKEVAKQFESILVHMMLKSMREANAVFEEDGMFQSSQMDFYQDMMDHELALHFSQGKGMGLADSFYQQLLRQFDVDEQHKAAVDAKVQPLDAATRRRLAEKVLSNKAEQAPSENVRFENQQDFLQKIYPHAESAAKTLGVDPAVLLAQSALETGWGQHLIKAPSGTPSYNLFNIKADQRWKGDTVDVTTLEFRDGVMNPERAAFRRYQDFGESMQDYVNFVRGESRYQNALDNSQDAEAYIKALHEAGYATDPDYSQKIIQLLQSDSIRQVTGNR